MAMLGLFDAEHRDWSLDEMVPRLGVSRMTAYRMARTLQGTGHLVHDPSIGGYRLGPAMLAGIYLAEGFAQLVEVARPYLESLVDRTGELVAIAVELDGVAVCADLVASARPFVPEIAVGKVIGDTANAHGKMFAALKSERGAGAHLAQAAQEAHGEHHRRPRGTGRRAREDQGRGPGVGPRGARSGHLRRGRTGAQSDWRCDRHAGLRGAHRALRARGPETCARAARSTAMRLSEYYGYARSAEPSAAGIAGEAV